MFVTHNWCFTGYKNLKRHDRKGANKMEVGRSADFSTPSAKGRANCSGEQEGREKSTKELKADGGKTRGNMIQSDHARGGAGVRRRLTLAKHLLRPRPVSVGVPLFKSFKCSKKGCRRWHELGDRWFYDVVQKVWRYVGPVCRPKGGHSAAEMVPCLDAKGKTGAGQTKELPFVGNSAASTVVRNNQGAYAVWLEEEAARQEEQRRYLEYGTETESDVDFNDAQTYYQEGSLWREGSGLASMSLVDLCSQIYRDPADEGASGSLVER
ncbi:unnamed protein product [Pylaiella littoralis]